MLLLLLVACVENSLGTRDKGGSPDDTAADSGVDGDSGADSGPDSGADSGSDSGSDSGGSDSGSDSGVDSGADTGPPPPTCPDEAPPDGVVAADVSCEGTVTPFAGAAVELWRVTPAWSAIGVHVTRLYDGDGDGGIDARDPMQVVLDESSTYDQVGVYDEGGRSLATWAAGSSQVTATTGDVDPTNPGAEVIASGYAAAGFLQVADERASSWSSVVPDDASVLPWVTDLEGDGGYEVLAGPYVLDAATGAIDAELVGDWSGAEMTGVSADLDGDGVEEILFGGVEPGVAGLYAPDGTLLAECHRSTATSRAVSFAVGDLDGDAGGEFVAAGTGFLAACDSDGSPLTVVDADLDAPALVGLAQLDADAAPEIVVGDSSGVVAYDTDLSRLWTYAPRSGSSWYPFALADLDGDGHHEVIVHDRRDVVVLDVYGRELARWTVHSATAYSWKNQPAVVDIDADGLAEIVVGSVDLVAVESPDGGWPVRDAQYPWPGNGRHPGDRTLAGGIVAADPFWLDPERNVWQGLPAGADTLPELEAAVTDVCVERCDGDAVVTVAVGNPGVVDLRRDVPVRLETLDTAVLLGEQTVAAPLPAGVVRSVTFRIPASALAAGLRATVDPDEHVAECDVRANAADWRGEDCP